MWWAFTKRLEAVVNGDLMGGFKDNIEKSAFQGLNKNVDVF